jgi:aprataxin
LIPTEANCQKSALKEKDYGPLLKEDLNCFICEQGFRTIPKLKEHLLEEWDKKARKAKASSQLLEKKRRRETEDAPGADDSSSIPDPKRRGEKSG